MEDDDEMKLFSMSFSCGDVLGGILGEDPNDFVTEHHFKIHTCPDGPDQGEELVGKGKLSLIQFSLAMDAKFPLRDVMDATAAILEMSEAIFSWEEGVDPFEKLDTHFEGDLAFIVDVCFVERVEVLPAFRGQGIGRAALISIARKFYNSCGLIVLKAFPLQHEGEGTLGYDETWAKAMGYDALEKDFERSQHDLFHWYRQMGLNNPFDLEYFIARPHQLAHLPMFGQETTP